MTDDPGKRLDRIKKVLKVDQDKDLADLLGMHKQSVYRWRKHGFHGAGIEALLDELLKAIRRKPKQRSD